MFLALNLIYVRFLFDVSTRKKNNGDVPRACDRRYVARV